MCRVKCVPFVSSEMVIGSACSPRSPNMVETEASQPAVSACEAARADEADDDDEGDAAEAG